MAANKTIKIDIDVVNKDFKSVQTELKELAKLIGNLSKAGISETPKAFKDMMEASSALQTKIGTLSTTIDNALKNKRLGKELRDNLKEVNKELDNVEQRARTVTGKAFSSVLTPKKEMVSPVLVEDKKQKALDRKAQREENQRQERIWVEDGKKSSEDWAKEKKRIDDQAEADRKTKANQTKASIRQELRDVVNLYKTAYKEIEQQVTGQKGKRPGSGIGWAAIKEQIVNTRDAIKVEKAGLAKGTENRDLVQKLALYDVQLAAQERFVNQQLALEKKLSKEEELLRKKRLEDEVNFYRNRTKIREEAEKLLANRIKEASTAYKAGLRRPTLPPYYSMAGDQVRDPALDWQRNRRRFEAPEFSSLVKTKANDILSNISKVKELKQRIDELKGASSTAAKEKLFAQPDWFPGLKLSEKQITSLSRAIKNGLTVDLKQAEIAANGMRSGLGRALNNIRNSIFDLAKFQARWYLTKFALFEPLRLGGAALTGAFEFTKMIDMWEAKLLRWEATSGKVSDAVRGDMAEIIKSARALALQYPVTVDEILKTTEGFISAGMPSDIVKKLVPTFTKLKTSFPEINMEQFAPAIVGAWNAWKTTIGETADEAQKFTIILEKLLYAQAKGVIKPENFTVLLQHLSEMGRVSGLTLDQLLALSIGVTDLGSKTGSAARSLRQFLQQLQSAKNMDKVAKWMKEVGVEINSKQPLGPQLFKIIEGFQKLVGAGGPRSMQAMKWLREIFPLETLKSASSIIDYFEKIKNLAEKELPNAMGGLDTSSKLMLDRLGSRVILLQNQMKELSSSISGSIAFKELFALLNDMAFGALLAFNNEAAKAVTSLGKLGDAGKFVYGVIKGVTTPFEVLGDALSGIWSIAKKVKDMFSGKFFGQFTPGIVAAYQTIILFIDNLTNAKKAIVDFVNTSSYGDFSEGIKNSNLAVKESITLFEILGVTLSSIIGAALITWLTKIIVMSKIIQTTWATIVLTLEQIRLQGFINGLAEGLGLTKSLIGPWGLIGIAIAGVLTTVTLFVLELGKAKKVLDELAKKSYELPDWMAQQKLDRARNVQERSNIKYTGKDRATSEEMKEVFGSNWASWEARQSYIRKLEYRLLQPKDVPDQEAADAEKQLERAQAVNRATPGGDKGPPGKSDKTLRTGKEFSIQKKEYQEEIKLLKDAEAEKLAILEQARDLNYISELEYIEKRSKAQEDSEREQLAKAKSFYENVKSGSVKAQLNKDLAKLDSEKSEDGKDIAEKKRQLQETYDNQLLEARRDVVDRELALNRVVLKDYTDIELAKRKIAKETLDLEIALQQIKREEVYQTKQSELDRAQRQSDYLYEHFDISATKAAENEIKTAEITKNLKIENNREALQDKLDSLALEAEAAGNNEVLLRNIAIRVQTAFENQRKEDSAATQDWLNKLQDMYQKFAQNIRLIFDKSGVTGVFIKVLSDMSKQFGDVATNLKTSIETVVNGMASSLENFFDVNSADFLNWKKLVLDILNSIMKEMIKLMIIQPLMKGITGGISAALNGGYAPGQSMWNSVAYPGLASGGKVSLNKAILVGERGPELFTPSSSGYISPNSSLGATIVKPVVNVYNNNGSNVSTKTRSDNGKLEIDVMIDQMVAGKLSKFGSASNKAMRQNFNTSQRLTAR